MRAARLTEGATTLALEDVPDLQPRPGAAVVRVHSTFVSSSLAAMIRGAEGYVTPPRPFTPGMDAIGTVVALGDGASGVGVGDVVYCDAFVEDGSALILAGVMGLSGRTDPLLAAWPDGALATYVELPAECLTDVSPALGATHEDALTRLGWLGTAHAGLERAGFREGDAVTVVGATGLLGSSAVLLALAMGASSVTAVGRSPERLARLAALDPRVQVRTPDDLRGVRTDVLVVAVSDGHDAVEAALPTLRRFGRVAMITEQSRAPRFHWLLDRDITIRFSLWFPRSTPARLVDMVATGALDLSPVRSEVFGLDDVEPALEAALAPLEPLHQVVVRP